MRETSTGSGTLPFAEAGDLDALGEVGGGVLDGVVDIRTRDVDREPDLVVRQLLDLGAHRPIRPNPV
jgi:hypothetical protein